MALSLLILYTFLKSRPNLAFITTAVNKTKRINGALVEKTIITIQFNRIPSVTTMQLEESVIVYILWDGFNVGEFSTK